MFLFFWFWFCGLYEHSHLGLSLACGDDVLLKGFLDLKQVDHLSATMSHPHSLRTLACNLFFNLKVQNFRAECDLSHYLLILYMRNLRARAVTQSLLKVAQQVSAVRE